MPYFTTEKQRQQFNAAAERVTHSTIFEDLLAAAASDQAAEMAAHLALRQAQERARISFNAVFDEAGRPKPHTPESSAFWKRWDAAKGSSLVRP